MITLEYMGIEGTGRTLRDAKADAARKVRGLVAAVTHPEIHILGGYTIVAWMTGENECAYTFTHPGDADGKQYHCCMFGGTIKDAVESGKKHVAQLMADRAPVVAARDAGGI